MTTTSPTAPAFPANLNTPDRPDAHGQPVTDADDRYFDTLRTLSARAATAKAAMLDAHLATTPHERTAALVGLHHHLRGMASIVNDAIGSIGGPQDPR
jgi:hypothetical protein